MIRSAWSHRIAISALLLASCTSDPTTLLQFGDSPIPDDPPHSDLAYAVQASLCRVDVEPTRSFSCDATGAGTQEGEAAIIVGGQGTYVEITGDSVVRVDDLVTVHGVTVTNLMVQQLGTSDGLTVAGQGIRIFFQMPPTNGVEIANADGNAPFLEAGQPYHRYEEILMPGETSGPRDWQFDVSASTEDAFTFGVLVHGAIPTESGVLLIEEDTAGAGTWQNVWATSKNHAIAVGSSGYYSIYDGESWSPPAQIPGASSAILQGVWASDPTNVWVVGLTNIIYRYDGETWTPHTAGTNTTDHRDVRGVWGTASGDTVFAAAMFVSNSAGRLIMTTRDENGQWSDWSQVGDALPDHGALALHATASDDIWVGGGGARIYHWNGADWSARKLQPDPTTTSIQSIWATSDTEVWAVGGNGAIFRTTDGGGSWTNLRGPDQPFPSLGAGVNEAVWAPLPDYAWIGRVTSGGPLQHFDGGRGFSQGGTSTINGIHGPSPDEFWAVGENGVIRHGYR